MKNLIGKTIKRYQILLKVRETATRILYKAFDTQANKYTGVEVLKIENIRPRELLAILKEQAAKNSKLIHPNIAKVTDSGTYEGLIYLVIDKVPVQTLRRLFKQTYSWNQSAREFVAISQAMAYAHQEGIVHGSLDPSCIIFDEDDHPFIYDFGYEQIIQKYVINHSPGAWIKGWKYPYSSPEQLSGKPTTARSDVYSMGIILYEWMTGEIPLLDETTLGTLYRRATSSLEGINSKKAIAPVVFELIRKSIDTDPNKRYPSMQEFSIVLAREALGLVLTEKIVRNPQAIDEEHGKSRSHWTIYPIMLLTIIILAMLTSLWLRGDLAAWYPSSTPNTTMQATSLSPEATGVHTQEPAQEDVTETAEMPMPSGISYPIYEGTALPALEVISRNNTDRMIMLSILGVGEINRYALSPDGKSIAVATSMGVFIYDAETMSLVTHLNTRSWVSAVEFSGDGKTIASGDRDGLIVLWDATTWDEIRNYSGHRSSIIDLAFSPDGSDLVSIALDDTMIKWESGQETSPIYLLQNNPYLSTVTYSPDGSLLITGGIDSRISIWDAKEDKLLSTINTGARIVDIKCYGQPSFIAVGDANRRISIIDLSGKVVLTQATGLQFSLSSIAISPDGNFMAAADVYGGIAVWDMNGHLLWKYTSANRIETPASELLSIRNVLFFSPDGRYLYSGLRNGLINVFDAVTGTITEQYGPINNNITKFELSDNSKTGLFQTTENTISVWNLAEGRHEYTVPGAFMPGTALSGSGAYFAAMTDQSTIKAYVTASGIEILSMGGNNNVKAIRFVNGDQFLAVLNPQGIRLWSTISGQEIRSEWSIDDYGCTTISALDKEYLLQITRHSYLFENTPISQSICNFPMEDQRDVVLISELTRQIIVGGYHKLEVYDLYNTNDKSTMDGTEKIRVVKLTVDPDGEVLAVALDDHSIHIWDIQTREDMMTLYGHGSTITDLHFSRDGKMLISSSTDGTIRIWGVP